MAYLVNTARLHTLTIGGTDYTNNLVSFDVADSSANRNGLVSTQGAIVLGNHPGGPSLISYTRQLFKRGQVVLIDMQWPGGAVFRHPRGFLYVLSVTYDPGNSTLQIEVGCRLTLMRVTEEIDDLLPFLEVELKPESISYANIAAALAFTGDIVYQNNLGQLVKRRFFYPSELPAGFLTILGVTALDVGPLSGLKDLPNALVINYQSPIRANGDAITDITIDTEVSDYYLRFPLKTLERVPPEEGVPGISDSSAAPRNSSNNTDCGNTPGSPTNDPTSGRDNDTESCSSGFKVVDVEQYLPATKTSIQRTYSRGPSGQVNRVEQEIYGPAIEINNQYFTDKYAYCVTTYSSACFPSGMCSTDGKRVTLQAKSVTENFYDADGALVKTITSNYENVGRAAIPTDWRSTYKSGIDGTEKVLWRGADVESKIFGGVLYLASQVINKVLYQGDRGSSQLTTTYTSTADRGVGISSVYRLDARMGVKTTQTRTSKTISANPLLPDRTNNATSTSPETTDEVAEFPVFTDTYVTPPDEAGPVVVQESLPVEVLGLTRAKMIAKVEAYGRYLVRWLKAEALGLQISEAVLPEIVSDWFPGKPLRYYDHSTNTLMAAQFDAGAWSVADDGSAVTFKAAYRGLSNGTVVLPSNLVGNSTPDIPDPGNPGNPTPPAPVIPGEVTGETSVSDGSLSFIVDIRLGVEPAGVFGGKNGSGIVRPWPLTPGENEARANSTTVCYVNGMLVESGTLVSLEANGGIPLSANNILITDSTTVLDADLFAP